jgi:hypothetical protein
MDSSDSRWGEGRGLKRPISILGNICVVPKRSRYDLAKAHLATDLPQKSTLSSMKKTIRMGKFNDSNGGFGYLCQLNLNGSESVF